MEYEAIGLAVLAGIISPILVKSFEYVISLKSKTEEEKKKKVDNLENNFSALNKEYQAFIISQKDLIATVERNWQIKFDEMEIKYQAKIDELKEANIQLRINIVSLEVYLKQKDETIARFTTEINKYTNK